MNEKEVHQAIRDFVLSDLIRDDSYPLADDEKIVTTGLIDSFAMAELGAFVEERFGVNIPDSDLTAAKMDSLDLMVARVMRG